MYLRDIEIRCNYADIWKATGIKNTECIELLYLRALKNKMQCDNIVKINIYLVPIGEKLKEASNNAEVMDLSTGFNFSTFNDIPDAFNKKKFLLNAMQAALIDFALLKKFNPDFFD